MIAAPEPVDDTAPHQAPGSAGRPRVIVAVNGSEASYGAVGWARRVTDAIGALLTVLEAYEDDDPEMDAADSRVHLDEIEARLSRDLDEQGVRVDDVIVEHGGVADVIARHADDDLSMIVLGAHSADGWHSRSHRELVVSLARKVSCPIVAVPPGDWFEHGRVMVGIDGSDANRAVFRWAGWLAGRLGWPVIAVHVSDPLFRTFGSDDRLSPEDNAVRHEIEKSDAEFVERVAAEVDRSLVEYAEIRSATLLVIGARVHHSLGGRLVGGVTSGVIEDCSCPVAMIPRAYQLDHE